MLVHDALDEVADRGLVIVDDVAGSESVGGDENLGMKAGTEEVDGNHRRSS